MKIRSTTARLQSFVASVLCALVINTTAHGAAVLGVSTLPSSLIQGNTFSLNITVAGADDLFAFQFDLLFDSSVIRAQHVAEGAFLGSGGATFFVPGTINNTAGSIDGLADTLVGFVPGVDGDGLLMMIAFDAIGFGAVPISFGNALFLNSNLADITSEVTVPTATVSVQRSPTAVSEPSTVGLLAIAFVGMALTGRSRRPFRTCECTPRY
jgi:general secretion pathway protein D